MNLTDFQTTIQALVKLATGYDNGHVIWQKQTRNRPSRPFVGLDILEDETSFFTEDTTEDASSPVPGAEINLIAKEHIELNVQVIVYTSDVTGTNNATNVARKIRGFFSRESTTTALGDIALVERAPVRDATIVLETEHEGRGVLGLKFRVADLEVETTTYIETVTVETTVEQSNGVPVVRTLEIERE